MESGPMPNYEIPEYELVERMATGVRSDLFQFGLLPGAVCLVILSFVTFMDGGEREFWHVLPWILVFSLLTAMFFGGAMTKNVIRRTIPTYR
jgi:hypothetical protein